ncbi:MAG: hypothetical protein HYU36_23825 [Planctomycetes bacterium]|nr:hypothetical protein [Planctomycetota bacterium]
MKLKAALILFLPASIFAALFLAYRGTRTAAGVIEVDDQARTLRFPARFNPHGFESDGRTAGYHLIVWERGGAASSALFQAEPSDRAILEALRQLGARPSNNLTAECWTRREDPEHPAPDLRAEGPTVAIRVQWPGSDEGVALHTLFEGVRPEDLDFRFVGNEALIGQWKSGCISCLYSCPGGKVVNAAYSIRDYTRESRRFRLAGGNLPAQGTPAWILLELLSE